MNEGDKVYRTMKVWRKTFRQLRILSALLDESIVSIIDRLVESELKKVKHEDKASL
jgi:hypothetical protein